MLCQMLEPVNPFTTAGNPPANTFAGATTLAFTTCSDTTTGAIYIGGNKTPDTRHLLGWEGAVSGFAPVWLWLVDILGYYPSIDMNSSATQTTNSTAGVNKLPNRQGVQDDGVGVRAFLEITTASGATGHALSMTYTNTALASGKTLPVTVDCTASAIITHITHSGTAANNYGPFLPLAVGDLGIVSVQDVKLSLASGAGRACLVLARLIAPIPIATQNVAAAREYLMNCPIASHIPDGACLAVIRLAGGATTASMNYYGHLEFGWG